jgi:hypothetical protein
LAVVSGISNGFQMVFKGFRSPMGASYAYAEEVHPTGFAGGDAASRRAAARDAEGGRPVLKWVAGVALVGLSALLVYWSAVFLARTAVWFFPF